MPEISMSTSRIARTACSLGGTPAVAPKPADITRYSLRPLAAWRNNPSAIGLRQIFPVQTNKITFMTWLLTSDLATRRTSSTAKSARTRAERSDHRQSFEHVERADQDR